MNANPILILMSIVSFECAGPAALAETSFLVGWGKDPLFKNENVPGSASATVPVQVPLPTDCAVVTVTPGRHGLALCDDGRVFSWRGRGDSNGSRTSLQLSNVVAISSSVTHAVALMRNGTVTEWKEGTNGPALGFSNLVAVAAGFDHTIAINSDGTLIGWGRALIPRNLNRLVAVSATPSVGYDLGVDVNGNVIEWNVGVGSPSQVPGVTNIVAVASGGSHRLALRSDGVVYGWGRNSSGEATGKPTSEAPYAASGLVAIDGVPLKDVMAIAACDAYSLALRKDGTLVAWGSKAFGLREISPELTGVISIAAGGSYCLAITTNAVVAERFRR